MSNERTDNYIKQLEASHDWLKKFKLNWDENNAEPFDVKFLDTVFEFVKKMLEYNVKIPIPKRIYPVDEDSIEMLWNNDSFKIRIIFSNYSEQYAVFMYHDYNAHYESCPLLSDQLVEKMNTIFV